VPASINDPFDIASTAKGVLVVYYGHAKVRVSASVFKAGQNIFGGGSEVGRAFAIPEGDTNDGQTEEDENTIMREMCFSFGMALEGRQEFDGMANCKIHTKFKRRDSQEVRDV
jgi:hypothetical protein